MKFDRNTVIGVILLAVLFFGMFWFNSKEQNEYLARKREQDRIAYVKDSTRRAIDSINRFRNPPPQAAQPLPTAADSAGFQQLLHGTESTETVETPLLRIRFSNKGGQPKSVELKKFKGPDSADVKLGATGFDRLTYAISLADNKHSDIDSLYFSPAEKTVATDSTTTVTYKAVSAEGKAIVHQFVIHPKDYMVDFSISIDGAQQVVGGNTLNLTWQANAVQQQKDITYERGQSKIGYRLNGDFDNHSAIGGGSKEFKGKVDWLSVKQQFFNYTLLAKNGFSSGNFIWSSPTDSSNIAVQGTANMQLPLQNGKADLGLYYGPNDYSVLKQYHNDMADMVDLGSGMFAFVKYINRYIVIPAFNFFSTLTKNYGIVILLLTLLIRLIVSPLMYPGYLTSAKMKILRPEMEQLKVKYPDQQQYAMEQMKFTREAGVNQFAGCLPGLFQLPIFFSLYSFFNSNVALRGQSFLWAKDLSQYDSILDFGHIPVIGAIYGSHVSLFTITAVLTSFLISLYSMSMTPDQSNPVMKYMPYFFPVILLFVFNKLPAGLTWYYTVSNLITLGLQYVIQNHIINHDKLLAKIEAARKKPKTKSKWQEQMEKMQEQQKALQQQRKK